MKKIRGILLAFIIICMAGCSNTNNVQQPNSNMSNGNDMQDTMNTELSTNSDAMDETKNNSSTINNGEPSNGAVNISNATIVTLDNSNTSVDGSGATFNKNVLNITRGGTYVLSGELNGQIYVNSSDNSEVNIILNGVKITNNDAAIFVYQAGSAKITLADNSINYLYDTDTTLSSASPREATGAIFSKEDLVMEGSGQLNLDTLFNDGIVSRDTLVINNGTYNITSVDDGILGKDSLTINGGIFTISSGGDSLKTSNDTDASLGYMIINNGSFNLTSAADGLQAETALTINNGTFTIKTSGNINNVSSKGLKAISNIVIKNGTISIDSTDDSIHSNGDISITNGTLTLSSKDDGIHADNSLEISGGKINIVESYEGLEGTNITINDGEISITSSDDGINIAGGTDSSGMGPQMDRFNTTSSNANYLRINGGNVYVNANGDGLDSNGNIEMNGGVVIVEGPSNSANGALDYDGTFNINGGTLLAIGASGMAQTPSSTSAQYTLAASMNNTQDTIEITDSNGNTIYSFIPTKSYSSVIYSSANLIENETYTISAGDTVVGSSELNSTVTYINSNGAMGNQGEFGNKGDQGMGTRPSGNQHQGGMRP